MTHIYDSHLWLEPMTQTYDLNLSEILVGPLPGGEQCAWLQQAQLNQFKDSPINDKG